jgi:cytoskeleton protein RodZ
MSEELPPLQEAEERGSVEPTPGAILARTRAERKMGLAEVAERLKYSPRQIEAIEADEYESLPGGTFVRGMIRGYAKLLEIDPAPVLKALDRRNIPVQASVDLRTRRIPFPDSNKRATRPYLAVSLVALVVIAGVLYESHFSDKTPEPVAVSLPQRATPVAEPVIALPPVPVAATQPATQQAATVQAVTPQAAAAATVQAAAPQAAAQAATPQTAKAAAAPVSRRGAKRIQLDFQNQSWVEIKDRDGNTLLSDLNPADTRKTVEGMPPFAVVIGNASGVRLTYDDKPFDLKPHVKVEVARFTLE